MALAVPDRIRDASARLLPWVGAAFLGGVLAQTYLAGRSTLGTAAWGDHVSLGHALSLPAALIVILAYLGPFGKRVRRLAWGTLATYYVTVTFAVLRVSDGFAPLAPLHPVLAMLTVLVSAALVAEAAGLRLVRGGDAPETEG